MDITYKITPAELLLSAGIQIARSSGNWLTAKHCPVCCGGNNSDPLTFIVNKHNGGFKCTRDKCGVKGNFWQLFQLFGIEPRDYVESYGNGNNNYKNNVRNYKGVQTI